MAVLLENWVAYTFGIISPKSRSTKVINTAWNKKPIKGAASKLSIVEVKCVKSKITPTFTKLLLMRIVARSRWGVWSNFKICCSDLALLFSSSEIVCGGNEKKATSDADIMMEQISSATLAVKEITEESVMACIEMPENELLKIIKLTSY